MNFTHCLRIRIVFTICFVLIVDFVFLSFNNIKARSVFASEYWVNHIINIPNIGCLSAASRSTEHPFLGSSFLLHSVAEQFLISHLISVLYPHLKRPFTRVSVCNFLSFALQSPTPPQYVFWYHNDRMINYDTSRNGISVETLPGAQTQSRLIIRDTNDSDTGNYTCSASNTEPASIYVFVEEGKKS